MRAGRKRIVGVDYDEGPPVPIPNTEVKLVRAENTWLVTAREDRCSPTQEAVAQSGGCFFALAAQAARATRLGGAKLSARGR